MDREIFEKLIELHGDRIFSFCCRICENRDDADDLFQNTMMKAFELRKRINADSEEDMKRAANYIIGISVKLNKERLRRKRREAGNVSLDDDNPVVVILSGDPEKTILEKDEIQMVRKAVSRLPEKLKHTIYLYYYAQMSVEDISSLLKIPKGTVMSRLYKGREKLRQMIDLN